MPETIRPAYERGQAENTPHALAISKISRHDRVMREMVRIRESRGLSQGQLAEMAGCTQATISRLESGKMKPRYELIEAIAAALKVHPGALFTMPELQARVIDALARMPADRQAAALLVLEAMAAGHPAP
jgi:transcriptional regulator with XRE-family HTH domain